MINLFIPYYTDKVHDRKLEVDSCVIKNFENKAIGKIYIVSEEVESMNWKRYFNSDRVEVLIVHYRPTYATLFDLINSVTGPDDWNVVINSDIYTDETISLLQKYDHNDFIALSRWDVDKAGNEKHYNTWDSQDTWCFKGKARKMDADFFQGVAGCDNAIAERAHRDGYRVLNPSKTIKTYHLHNTGVRNYNPNVKVPKPYKFITPHE